jgi:hypothetical protein
MTLREKFIKCRNKLNQYYVLPITDDAEQLEKISDDYAIEFAEWLKKSGHLICLIKGSIATNKLLEIFKKEKGL